MPNRATVQRAARITRMWTCALAALVWLAPIAQASDARDPLRGAEPPGCAERPPETEASLRDMVSRLQGADNPFMLPSWDRMRCAIHHHPQLALRLMLPLIGEKDRLAALAAAKAMGQIGPGASASVPGLTKLLGAPDPDSRAMAAQSLARIGPAAEPAVDALIEALDDENPPVRREATRALA
ncbi:MAG: HEAT repeat domain-containing protein, partial [Deltaproteobacteria bacterium]|nr:HEAT repeat domain-containing protein [Deltaproteobacteria bacterium]